MQTALTISPRELEVLEKISLGMTTTQTARELFVSYHTALSHRKNLLAKLNAQNVAHLIRIAFELKLLSINA